MSSLRENVRFGSYEKYGRVSLRHRRRRKEDHSLIANSHILIELDEDVSPEKSEMKSFKAPTYKHMNITTKMILPAILALYFDHHSPLPLIVTIYSSLVLYALDLCCFSDMVLIGIWISFWAISMSIFHEFYRWNDDNPWGVLGSIFDVSLIGCLSCIATLKHKWLAKDVLVYAIQIEKALHTVLPFSSAGVVTHTLTSTFDLEEMSSYVYLFLLHYNFSSIRRTSSSFDESVAYKEISFQKILLLLSPAMIRLWCSFSWDINTLCDLLLLSISSFIFQQKYRNFFMSTQNIVPVSQNEKWVLCVGIFVATLAFDTKYLLPLSHYIAKSLGDVKEQSPLIVCSFFSIGLFILLFSIHLSNKRNDDGRLVLGKSHDDIILIMALFSIIVIGSAFPLSLDVLFLIATSVILLGVFTGTKMVRFLLVSLFLHGSGLTLFGLYRFRFENSIVWIIPGYMKLDLFGLYLMEVCLGCIVLLTYGFAASSFRRSKSFFKMNLAGAFLGLYSILLPFVEACLHFTPLQNCGECCGTRDQSQYSFQLMVITSIATIGISVVLRQQKVISALFSSIDIAISLGKVISLLIEAPSNVDYAERHSYYIFNFLISSSFMVFNMLVLTALKSSIDNGLVSAKQYGILRNATSTSMSIMRSSSVVYIFSLLPLTLFYVVKWIWNPFILTLKGVHEFYLNESLPLEIFAGTLTLWGILVFSVFSALLPNNVVIHVKRISFMVFVFGATLYFFISAPDKVHPCIRSNPYLSISYSHEFRHDPLNGGFGIIISGSVALCLVIFATLSKSSRKLQMNGRYSISITLCIVLFSCGICWFFTIQTVKQGESVALTLFFNTITSLSYTGSSIICYGDTTADFSSAIHITKISHGISMIMLSVSIFAGSQKSTWLCFSIYSFFSSIVLRMKQRKTDRTKALGNLLSLLSWAAVIVFYYCKHGISIASSRGSNILIVHKSISVTFLASILLLPIEASCKERRLKMSLHQWKRLKYASQSYGLLIPRVSHFSLNFSVAIFLTGLVLIVATLYKIFFHGILGSFSWNTYSDFVTDADNAWINLVQEFSRNVYNVELQARFDGSGFFTSSNAWVPFRHLLGLIIAPLPTWYIYFKHLCQTAKTAKAVYFIPMHIFPLLFCSGIPSLRAITALSLMVSIFIARIEFQDILRKSQIL